MSEEEKKAIEIIKEEIIRPNETALEVYVTDIKMLLHLIEKQQKEIKELQETLKCTQNSWFKDTQIIEKQRKEIEELKKPRFIINTETNEIIKIKEENCISKDKIKTKIEDCRFLLHSFEKDRDEKLVCDGEESINCLLGQISILNSLLEEN